MLSTLGSFKDHPKLPQHGLAFVILFAALLAAYANSFHADWHFDDFTNIVNNPNVQPAQLSFNELSKSRHGKRENGWSRPVAYLSFALNYLFGGKEVFGYHLVNFVIHLLSSFFLFLFCRKLLLLPLFPHQYHQKAFVIALMTSLLWALNPIQVTAVTVIVQRMASLAGLFVIMSGTFYLYGRTAHHQSKQILFYGMTIMSGAMAILSKENGAMLPVDILLIEFFFFTTEKKLSVSPRLIMKTILLLGLFLMLTFYFRDPFHFSSGYEIRPFSLSERLLTQGRILIFYLSLIFFPSTNRMTFLYDFEVSQSLINPLSTLVSLLMIGASFVLCILFRRKYPLLSFAILFFFLNHLVESTIIPLELIYEHRNYLPAMFLYLPITVAIFIFIPKYFPKRIIPILAFIILSSYLFSLGHTTFTRNKIFQNDIRLWLDNVTKQPGLMRPWNNLATALFLKGDIKGGYEALQRANGLSPTFRNYGKYHLYFNFGQYYTLTGDSAKAETYYQKALEIDGLPDVAKRTMQAKRRYLQNQIEDRSSTRNKIDQAQKMPSLVSYLKSIPDRTINQ